jgi:histidine triad (HIT) family protein
VTCIFCAIAADDGSARVVYADDAAVAFLDIHPVTTGHTLVIPRRHVDDLLDAAGALAEVAPAVEATAALLTDRLGADGVNLYQASRAAAGQTVFHLHVHLLPRWAGDGLISMHALHAREVADVEATYQRLLG